MATFYSYPKDAIRFAQRNGVAGVIARDLESRQYLDSRQASRPEYRDHTVIREVPGLGYGWEWVAVPHCGKCHGRNIRRDGISGQVHCLNCRS